MVQRIHDIPITADAVTTIDGVGCGEGSAFANSNNLDRALAAMVRNEFATMQTTITAASLTTVDGIGRFAPLGGNTTVDGFATAVTGVYRELRVLGTPLIKYNASTLITPDASDYQAAADDLLSLRSLGGGSWHMTVARKTSQTPIGKHMIPILAASMQAATTNGAAPGTVESTTNKVLYRTLDYDTTTQEFAGFVLPMPKSWNESTVTFRARWTAASGSGGVAFALQAVAFSDDDAIDTAYGTEQVVTDTLITAGDMHITAESSAITIDGPPAEGDTVMFRVKRVPANGSDTLAVDARLIAIDLFMTTNAGNDA